MVSLFLDLNLSCFATGSAETPRNRGAGLGEISAQPRESDRLLGAAGRIGLRIEIKDEIAPLEILQRDFAATVPWKREGRRLRTRNKFSAHMPSFRRFRAVMSHMPFAWEGRNGFHKLAP